MTTNNGGISTLNSTLRTPNEHIGSFQLGLTSLSSEESHCPINRNSN